MKSFDEYKQFETPLRYTPCQKNKPIHIGVVLLSTDHSLEMEWSKLHNHQSMSFCSRVYYSSTMTPTELMAIQSRIQNASELIAQGLAMDVMAFACTSASIVIGDKTIEKLLTLTRPNTPTTNPWMATKAALHHLGVNKIAVFAPYPSQINYRLYQQFVECGFSLSSVGTLGIEKDTEITKVSKESMMEGLEKILLHDKPDAIFMSCTNLRVAEHIEDMEARFQLPVISSNTALYWHALSLAGKKARCPGFGLLLNE